MRSLHKLLSIFVFGEKLIKRGTMSARLEDINTISAILLRLSIMIVVFLSSNTSAQHRDDSSGSADTKSPVITTLEYKKTPLHTNWEQAQLTNSDNLTRPADGSKAVTMSPGETKEVKNVRIGGIHTEIFYFDTILEIPDFMSFDTDDLRVLIPGGTRVDFTLEAANDATPGEYEIRVRYSFHNGQEVLDEEILTVELTIAAPLTADFSGSPREGEAPLTVDFTDESDGDVDSWEWDFGDGESSSQQNPSHTYQEPGEYTVELTVSGPGGSDSETKNEYITVNAAAPTADFSGSPREGDAPLTVEFDDRSSGDIDDWDWDFGDGNSSDDREPSHTYEDPGTYTVELTVTGPGGSDTRRRSDYITVNEPVQAPEADFRASPREGEAPLTVDFDDRSSGDIDDWDWDFGDGNSSNDREPTHTYEEPGTYTVELTVTGPGGSDTRRRSDYITVNEPVQAPEADFRASPREGEAPLTVNFDDRSSGDIDDWDWDFGDGNSSSDREPTHTYEDPGTYTVELKVTGPGGSDTRQRSDYITVMEPAEPPTANFSASPTEGQAPLTVQFTDQSTGDISSREWDFGDGATSNSTNPSHTYQEPGTYTVSLTVDNIFGSDTETKQNFITVTESSVTLNPPRNLSASVSENSVLLDWDSPNDGTSGSDTVEIAYDDGSAETGIGGNFSGAEMAVCFTPDSYPVDLFALVFIGGGDDIPDTYGVRAYLDPSGGNDGPSGAPVFDGSLQVTTSGVNSALFPESITITSGDFYITLRYLSGTTDDFVVGLDTDSDALRSWLKAGSGWELTKDLGFAGNLIIRGVVEQAGTAAVASSRKHSSSGFEFGPSVQSLIPLRNKTLESNLASGFAYQTGVGKQIFTKTLLARHSARAELQAFKIYRSEMSPVEINGANLLADVGATTTGFTDNDLDRGVVFHYVVTAQYEEGESGPSNEVSVEIPTTLIAPTLLSPSDGATGTALVPTLTWSSVNGAASYQLQIARNSDFTMIVVNQNKIVETSFQVSELEPGTVYFWRVRAINTTATSDWAEARHFTTIELPARPTPVDPANNATDISTNPTLVWIPSSGADSFHLQVSLSSGFETTVVDEGGVTNSSHVVNDLQQSTLYFWRVSAQNEAGTSDWSAVFQFTTRTDPVSVEQVDSAIPTVFQLHQNYPNPFNPETRIEYQLPKSSYVKLSIYNSSGQKIATLVNEQQPPGTYSALWNGKNSAGEDVASGIYLYQLQTSEFVKTRKLTLVR